MGTISDVSLVLPCRRPDPMNLALPIKVEMLGLPMKKHLNALTALALGTAAELSLSAMREALQEFSGLPRRGRLFRYRKNKNPGKPMPKFGPIPLGFWREALACSLPR